MDNKYLVIGWGFDKKDGKPFSKCAKIVSDFKSNKYAFIDLKNCVYLDHHEPVGKVITAQIKIV